MERMFGFWYNEAVNKHRARCVNTPRFYDCKGVTAMSDSTLTIPLTQGQVTVIDAVDADLAAFKWLAQKTPRSYYAIRFIGGRKNKVQIAIHRLILERKLGRLLVKGELCDHINGNALDNRRENLRLSTKMQNTHNQKRRRNNKSGYKGVCWIKRSRKWFASIQVNGKRLSLGYYDTPEEAHEAYCKAAEELHGEFARFE